MVISVGLGTVTSGSAGSGTTVTMAGVGALVRADASRIVMFGAEKAGALPSCPAKAADANLAISEVPTNSRAVLTLGKVLENGHCVQFPT